MTQIEKITEKKAGETVILHPDLTVITNGFSHAVTQHVQGVKHPEKAIVVYDHNVPAGLPEESMVFGEILKLAKTYGIRFKQAKGIAQKWLLEEGQIKAGDVVVSGTRHTAIVGSVGAMGVGISETELARVMESGEYQIVVPESIGVKVSGKLPENAGMIDAALSFLKNAGDICGKAVEFVGGELTQHEKEVLCEMATDTGALTAFAVDEGETQLELDLSTVVPMLRMPCQDLLEQTKADFGEAASLDGVRIQAGQIGGMNGGDIEDLRKAAKMMEGHKLKRGFRLSINPATSAVYLQALEEGLITKFIDYNAQINAAGDHDIVPQGAGAMGPQEKLLTTGLYTYAGAMGNNQAEIYTASVETVVRASFADEGDK